MRWLPRRSSKKSDALPLLAALCAQAPAADHAQPNQAQDQVPAATKAETSQLFTNVETPRSETLDGAERSQLLEILVASARRDMKERSFLSNPTRISTFLHSRLRDNTHALLCVENACQETSPTINQLLTDGKGVFTAVGRPFAKVLTCLQQELRDGVREYVDNIDAYARNLADQPPDALGPWIVRKLLFNDDLVRKIRPSHAPNPKQTAPTPANH